jgi:pyruvate dehydrogenase (quinone)
MRALLPLLKRKEDRSWRHFIESEVETWHRILDDRAHQKGDPINPELVFWELNRRLPDDVIMTSDSGSATNWYARHCMMREGMRGSLSGTLATMVPGIPYAISAKFAHPDRPVIGFTGDGAFEMLGMNELLTVKRYLGQLTSQNKTLVFVVLSNNDLNQVSMEQRALSGDPKNPETQTLPHMPAAEYARLLGFEGIRVDSPGGVAGAWDRALSADRPVLVEFVTDPQIVALPPHVKPTMAKKVAKGLLHGDEDATGIAEKGIKGKLTELTEHVKEKLPGDNG